MTIQGARDELINMMKCKDIPFYFVPILREVVKTIEMEIATVCDIEQIRAEIYETFMTIDGGVHDKSALKCMEIIDRYKKGE